jgi:hypothetical protein
MGTIGPARAHGKGRGGLVRCDVAVSMVWSDTDSDTSVEEAGGGRHAAAGDQNGAADR